MELTNQRRLIIFALALFIPVTLLTVLSGVSIRNDRVSFEWIQVQSQRDLLKEVHDLLELSADSAKFQIFQTLVPDSELVSKRPELYQRLDKVKDELPLVRGIFVTDAHHKLLYPRLQWPYLRAPKSGAQDAANKLERLRMAAAAMRVEEAIAGVRQDRSIPPLNRLAILKTLSTDEPMGSLPRLILDFSIAQEVLALGQEDKARLLFDKVCQHPRPVELHDGRCLRAEAALKCASLGSAKQRLEASLTLLDGLQRGRFRNLSARRFHELRQAGLDLGQKAAAKLDDEAIRKRWQRAVAEHGQFLEELSWLENLSGELWTDLQKLSPDPSPQGDWTRCITRAGDQARLICYRAFADQGGRSHVFVGFEVDLAAFAEHAIKTQFEDFTLEPGLSFGLIGPKGEILLEKGKTSWQSHSDQRLPTISKRPPAFPFWRIVVRRDPEAIENSATLRALFLLGLIALALIGVGFGAYSTFRFVHQSLELTSLKADFMSSITHELKTPLTSIEMFAEMLSLGRVRNDEKRLEYYNHIGSEAKRLRRMIDDILDFARSEAGKVHYVLSEADYVAVLEDALDLFALSAEASGFKIHKELPEIGHFPPVDVDREAMVRVFLNLLSNAVKYSLETLEITVKVWREGDVLRASVRDRGVGIDEKNLQKIFDKFFRAGDPLTREVSGTGLGLALVDSIVKAHEGRIEVESQKNEGSTFIVTLPIIKEYREQWPLTAPDPEQDSEQESKQESGQESGRGSGDAEASSSQVSEPDSPVDAEQEPVEAVPESKSESASARPAEAGQEES